MKRLWVFFILFFLAASLVFMICFKNKKLDEKESKIVTFVGTKETKGNGLDPNTMDYFQGVQYPQLSLIIPHLKKQGVQSEVVDWLDPTVDWGKKDAVVLGTVWGYTKHAKEFVNWLDMLEKCNATVLNHPAFLKWNLKKTYLIDLQKNGVNIPNTLVFDETSKATLEEAIKLFQSEFGDEDVIIKGVVDAGGFGYMHVFKDNYTAAKQHFELLKKNNCGVVMQKFLPEIYKKGELSFVFFNGKISHSFLKVSQLNEERVQPFYGGRSFHFKEDTILEQIAGIKNNFRSDLDVAEQEIKTAQKQAEDAYKKLVVILEDLNIPAPFYLRIDGVVVDSTFFLMEIEGIEPYLEMQPAIQSDPSTPIVENYAANLIELMERRK